MKNPIARSVDAAAAAWAAFLAAWNADVETDPAPLAIPPGPLGEVAGEIRTQPMNFPLVSDK